MLNSIPLFVSLSLLACVFTASESCASDPHPRLLRVMTYNTWYVFDHGQEQAAGRAFVKSKTPDVVGLQELTNIKPAKLKELGAAWEHPNCSLLKTSGFSVGLTSRWPIEVIEKRVKDMHHGFLHAQTNGVHYFVVHLSPFKWQVRRREADVILERVVPLLKAGEQVIVLGDFNAFSPEDVQSIQANQDLVPRMRKSDQEHSHVENLSQGEIDFSVMEQFLNSGLADTGKGDTPNNPELRITFPTGILTDRKTPSEKGQRIDFILSSANLLSKVKDCRIIREGDVNHISDHYPVVTDFQLD